MPYLTNIDWAVIISITFLAVAAISACIIEYCCDRGWFEILTKFKCRFTGNDNSDCEAHPVSIQITGLDKVSQALEIARTSTLTLDTAFRRTADTVQEFHRASSQLPLIQSSWEPGEITQYPYGHESNNIIPSRLAMSQEKEPQLTVGDIVQLVSNPTRHYRYPEALRGVRLAGISIYGDMAKLELPIDNPYHNQTRWAYLQDLESAAIEEKESDNLSWEHRDILLPLDES